MLAILIQGLGLLCVGVWGTIARYQEFGTFDGPAPGLALLGLLELLVLFIVVSKTP